MSLHFPLPLLLLTFTLFHVRSSPYPDLHPLLLFKSSSDTSNNLKDWSNSTNPCSWTGVSCLKNRVSRLVLENLGLRASFHPLTALTQLRVLSLKGNNFSGPIPNLSNLTALKLLFLSHNHFFGDFPETASSLLRLYRLDLSYNNLTGNIPQKLNGLTHLLTLRLESNRFVGSISGLNLQNLKDFNVSGNSLSGEIPESLSGFSQSTFGQNPGLCGPPLKKCDIETNPTKPGSDGALATPLGNTISSMPSSVTEPSKKPTSTHRVGSKISPLALISIIIADVLVLLIVSFLLYCYYTSRMKEAKKSKMLETEKIVYSSSPYPNQTGLGGLERGKMVFFEGVRMFELEDLLRASAEMLGKGGLGTAYKAVLDDGSVVAVKRLKEASFGGKKETEQHMEVLGRLRHQNLVSLRAYYFAREEKLLVCDFMPNASLFWLLHGNRGPGRTPLDWTTRLKIAAGAARGIAFIHSSCKPLKLIHGNIKSTNILIDNTGNARVSDFGLTPFAAPTSAPLPRSNGYRAPELVSSDGRKCSKKSDVYSFGVLVLEILTGKCPCAVDGGTGAVDLPRWVQSVVREEWTAEVFDLELMRYKDIEEEMVGLLQIGMACTSASPEQRPRMGQVVRMIEEIRGVDGTESVSDSPSLSEETGGVSK